MKRFAFIAICFALIIAGTIFFTTRNSTNTTATLVTSGIVEVTAVEASFRIPGRVRQRLIDEGAPVIAGQILATLETDDLDQELQQRVADAATAKAALAELVAGSRTEEIAQAAATVARFQAEATRTSADLARQEELYRTEIIAGREIESSRATNQAALAALNEARERLQLLQKGPRPESILQARSRADSADAALSLARNRLEHATLRSATNGIVLAKHIEPGEQVQAGTPVVTVGQLDEVWVRGYIPETELGRVKIGQQAQITTDMDKGKSYLGFVTFIAQEAEFTPKNVQTAKERVKLVYRIKISIKNPTHELKPGMPVDAHIKLTRE